MNNNGNNDDDGDDDGDDEDDDIYLSLISIYLWMVFWNTV